MWPAIIFIVLFIAFFTGLCLFFVRRQNKKREAYAQLAVQLGFSYDPKGVGLRPGEFEGFNLFLVGEFKKISNVFRGSRDNRPMVLFDYSYSIKRAGNKYRGYSQTVAVCEDLSASIPDFRISPEDVLDQIGSALGFQDIDFSEYPGFSKAYVLRSPGESAARGFFHAGILQFFERNQGWCVEKIGSRIIVYRQRKSVRPDGFLTFVEEVQSIFGQFDAGQ